MPLKMNMLNNKADAVLTDFVFWFFSFFFFRFEHSDGNSESTLQWNILSRYRLYHCWWILSIPRSGGAPSLQRCVYWGNIIIDDSLVCSAFVFISKKKKGVHRLLLLFSFSALTTDSHQNIPRDFFPHKKIGKIHRRPCHWLPTTFSFHNINLGLNG